MKTQTPELIIDSFSRKEKIYSVAPIGKEPRAFKYASRACRFLQDELNETLNGCDLGYYKFLRMAKKGPIVLDKGTTVILLELER